MALAKVSRQMPTPLRRRGGAYGLSSTLILGSSDACCTRRRRQRVLCPCRSFDETPFFCPISPLRSLRSTSNLFAFLLQVANSEVVVIGFAESPFHYRRYLLLMSTRLAAYLQGNSTAPSALTFKLSARELTLRDARFHCWHDRDICTCICVRIPLR